MSRAGWLRRHGKQLALSLVAGAVALWLLQAGALPLVPPAEALSAVPAWAIIGYVAAFSGVHYIRAVRWHWLLRPIAPVSVRRLTNVAFIGFAAIVILPLRSGEVVRPLMIRKHTDISGWAATGTIAAERVIDGFMVSCLLLLGLVLSTPLDPLPDRIGALAVPARIIPTAAYGALFVFACAFAVMGLFYARQAFARRLVDLTLGRVSPRLSTWVSSRVEQLALGLGFLRQRRHAWPFLGLSLVYWLGNAAATQLLAVGVGLSGTDYWIACVSMGVLALGILMPNAPGYFGAFQISVYASLAMYFPAADIVGAGACFVFIQYVVQTFVTLGAAAAALVIERRYHEAPALVPEAACAGAETEEASDRTTNLSVSRRGR